MMEWLKPATLISTLVYSVLGVIFFWITFMVFDKLTPFKMWEEIVTKKNQALGMVVAAMCIGIAIIIAAAIVG